MTDNSESQKAVNEPSRADDASGSSGQLQPETELSGEQQRAAGHHEEQPNKYLAYIRKLGREIEKYWRKEPVAVLTLVTAFVLVVLTLLQLRVNQDEIYSGQRAYLTIDNMRLISDDRVCTNPTKLTDFNKPLTPGDTRMWLQWDLRNSGQTPVHNVQGRFWFYIGPDKPPSIDSVSPDVRVRDFGKFIGAGGCQPSEDAPFVWLDHKDGRLWNDADAARLRSGKEWLWAQVVVDYDTVFKGVHGRTSICGYYDGSRFSPCGTTLK